MLILKPKTVGSFISLFCFLCPCATSMNKYWSGPTYTTCCNLQVFGRTQGLSDVSGLCPGSKSVNLFRTCLHSIPQPHSRDAFWLMSRSYGMSHRTYTFFQSAESSKQAISYCWSYVILAGKTKTFGDSCCSVLYVILQDMYTVKNHNFTKFSRKMWKKTYFFLCTEKKQFTRKTAKICNFTGKILFLAPQT